jgi:hypothetical protein
VGVGVGAASCRYEITSWKLEDAPEYDGAVGVRTDLAGAHVVFVVDNSGSMRKDDVVGYKSRTDAVYDCLLREFVDPQVSTDRGSPRQREPNTYSAPPHQRGRGCTRHRESGAGGLTREVDTPLPSNNPHDHMILRVELVGSHGR